VEKILLADDMNTHPFNEAQFGKDFLLKQGVVDEKVIVYGKSINTASEAVAASKYVKENKLKNVLLVTSQSHMRRALSAFEKQGAICDTLSVSSFNMTISKKDFIPQKTGFARLESWLYELAAYLSYKVKGFV